MKRKIKKELLCQNTPPVKTPTVPNTVGLYGLTGGCEVFTGGDFFSHSPQIKIQKSSLTS
jgi:hypothetical protein